MKLKSKLALHLFLASAVLLISCDVSTFAVHPQLPTPIPGSISLLAAQTAAAAATETAALIPSTLTPTLTPFPTQTPEDTSTATSTFIFLLPTLTPVNTSTSAVPTNEISGFTCKLIKQSPQDGASLNGNQPFKLTWKIQNTGSRTWTPDNVGLYFIGGDQFADTAATSLPSSITAGDSVVLSIRMTTPGQSGKYTTNWALEASGQNFCTLFLRISVR